MCCVVVLFVIVLGLLFLMGIVVLVLMLLDVGIDGLMQVYDGQVFGVVVLVLYDG